MRAWGRAVVAAHATEVAEVMGVAGPLPRIRVHVSGRSEHPAWTVGSHIVLGEPWLGAHRDEAAGVVVHELAHAVLDQRSVQDGSEWLHEGIADLVRNRIGVDAGGPRARFEPGGATAGYQTTAHFLEWAEARHPGTLHHLVRELRLHRLDERRFSADGCALSDLVEAYDAAH